MQKSAISLFINIMINIFKDLGFNIKSFKLNRLDLLKEDLQLQTQNNIKSLISGVPINLVK